MQRREMSVSKASMPVKRGNLCLLHPCLFLSSFHIALQQKLFPVHSFLVTQEWKSFSLSLILLHCLQLRFPREVLCCIGFPSSCSPLLSSVELFQAVWMDSSLFWLFSLRVCRMCLCVSCNSCLLLTPLPFSTFLSWFKRRSMRDLGFRGIASIEENGVSFCCHHLWLLFFLHRRLSPRLSPEKESRVGVEFFLSSHLTFLLTLFLSVSTFSVSSSLSFSVCLSWWSVYLLSVVFLHSFWSQGWWCQWFCCGCCLILYSLHRLLHLLLWLSLFPSRDSLKRDLALRFCVRSSKETLPLRFVG